MSKWPFSLNLLPLDGIQDSNMTIEMARGRLVNTLHIIDGILRFPDGLPCDLKQAIHNIRFHAVNGIGLIDGMLQLGYSMLQPASDVEALYDSIDNHLLELQKAKIIWNFWIRNEALQGYSGFVDEMAKPSTTKDYLASAGIYGMSRIPSLFHGDDINSTAWMSDIKHYAISEMNSIGKECPKALKYYNKALEILNNYSEYEGTALEATYANAARQYVIRARKVCNSGLSGMMQDPSLFHGEVADTIDKYTLFVASLVAVGAILILVKDK